MEMWQNLPIQMKLKVAAHFDRDLAMPRHVNQPDTWRQVLMVAIPGHAGADDFDEHRYLSLLATMSKWMVRILVERMRKATQTADSQQIPHNRPHVGLADECSVRHHQRGILACAEISSRPGHGEHGRQTML